MRKPKKLKYPKKPKQSASVSAWENYDSKVSEIDKANRSRMSDYEKAKKKKESIIKKYR